MAKQWISAAFVLGLLLTVGCGEHKEQKIASGTQEEGPKNEHLKPLEWLVGNWKDDEKDVNISYSTEWGLNHNFLVQHFESDLGESDEMQGDQVIGWDPIEKKVRSWIFDSEGGFGSSTWIQDGSIWYSSMQYTLSDGKKASAMHIYTKVDNDSYTFSSTNRDMNGELLPDIGPLKIIRTK